MISGKAVFFFHLPSLTQCAFRPYKVPSRITKKRKKINVIEHCVVTAIVIVDTHLLKWDNMQKHHPALT